MSATVKNAGPFWSPAAEVPIYLSQDSTIDPAIDLLLTTWTVESLAPGETWQYEETLTLPSLHPRDATGSLIFGESRFGLFIDTNDDPNEISRTNNANLGPAVDQAIVTLYDPTPPVDRIDFGDGTAGLRKALAWMLRMHFRPISANPPWVNVNDWTRNLPADPKIISPYDGISRPGYYYREQAILLYDVGARSWVILRQGRPGFGEPDPFYALRSLSPSWISYVYDWHRRF